MRTIVCSRVLFISRFDLWDKAVLHGSYRGANLDEVAVRVIKPDDPLSPAVRHQAIDVFSVRIKPFQLFYEAVNLRLFKIQLRMIALRNNASSRKPLPVFFFLEIQISG